MSEETQPKKRLVFGVDVDEPEPEDEKFDPNIQHWIGEPKPEKDIRN